MKKILYITNIQVPYRVKFFNELAKKCDLTVLYEKDSSSNRDLTWSRSITENYKKNFLNGINTGRETSFSLSVLKYVFSNYDVVIIGCYNSPVQMFAILIMRLFRRKFIISTDGELFIGEKGSKNMLKRFFLRGAMAYLAAGEKSAKSIESIVGSKIVLPYYFSSLTKEEIIKNSQINITREDFVLVVGQYYEYKGMDIAAEVAKLLPNQHFKFVGMGNRTKLFLEDCKLEGAKNIEVIPFLQREELYEQYRKCKCLLLPTRQECWGLVINEAASCGTPIVSTWGSGAAIEFLSDDYSPYLAYPGDIDGLSDIIASLSANNQDYEKYLKRKTTHYSIEKTVDTHLKLIQMI